METWNLYDYVDVNGVNQFKKWCQGQQKPNLAKINHKLDMLERTGMGLLPSILAGPFGPGKHIYKLKIKGRVALRPMLCKGPVNPDTEFTLLLGVEERDGELVPKGAPEIAEALRQQVLHDPSHRRCPHEHVIRPA